jgi:hypothetical protein
MMDARVLSTIHSINPYPDTKAQIVNHLRWTGMRRVGEIASRTSTSSPMRSAAAFRLGEMQLYDGKRRLESTGESPEASQESRNWDKHWISSSCLPGLLMENYTHRGFRKADSGRQDNDYERIKIGWRRPF